MRIVDAAARLLAEVPGGPQWSEARRRVSEGLPLIVGISRARSEDLQDRLVRLGLVPRLGPAPEGTAPLGRPAGLGSRQALGLAALGLSALVALLVWTHPREPTDTAAPASAPPASALPLLAPEPDGERAVPETAAQPQTVAERRRLELWAQVHTASGQLLLVGWVRARTAEVPPSGALALVGRADGREVVSESLAEDEANTSQAEDAEGVLRITRTLPFRLELSAERLAGVAELALEATWGGWRSEPTRVPLPQPER